MRKSISRRRFLLAGVVSGLIGAVFMSLFDLYNQESFSIFKFIIFFLIIGFLNSYLQFVAYKNSEKINEDMNT